MHTGTSKGPFAQVKEFTNLQTYRSDAEET